MEFSGQHHALEVVWTFCRSEKSEATDGNWTTIPWLSSR